MLAAAALALYWGGLGYPLVFDDSHLSPYRLRTYYVYWQQGGPRWLADMTYGWVYLAFGPGVYAQRLVNALLHASVGIALFALYARLLRALVPQLASTTWLAFFGSLAFVLHPVAVYGAGYLMQRSTLLATLFSVLALCCALEGLLRRSILWYGGAALAYVLALSSKEHAIMLPAAGLALAVLAGRLSGPAFARLGAWLGLCAIAAALTLFERRDLIGAAYEPFAMDILSRLGVDPALALVLSWENQGLLFFRYLATWLAPWPGWISADVRTAFPESLFGWHSVGLAAWLAWPVLSGRLLARGGLAGVAGFGMLAPWLLSLTEFAVVRVQEPFVLYRSYLWMIGLPGLAACGLAVLPRWRMGVAAGACAVLALLAHERLQTFSSAYALWDDAARKNTDVRAPYAERAFYSRGMAHLDKGRLEQAGADFERAVSINPDSPDARLTRGTWLLRSGRFREALQDLDRALALDPKYASAYNQRCVVRAELGRFAEAIADCELAVKLNPADDVAWINTGALYRHAGRRDEAAASYDKALALKPMSASAHYNYGVLLLDTRRPDNTVLGHFTLACQGGVTKACDLARQVRSVLKPPGK